MSAYEQPLLSYEHFEAKVYQYVGDSAGWARWVQQSYEKEGQLFLPLELKPFVSGFDPKHSDFRDSIKSVGEKVDNVQTILGRVSVGSGLQHEKPRVGIYVLAHEYEAAQTIVVGEELL